MSTRTPSSPGSPAAGFAFGMGAYLAWGFIAIYFKALKSVPAMLVLGHRVVWSVAFLAIVLGVRRELWSAVRCLRDRKTLLVLVGSTAMIGINWFTFIWAVERGRLVEASFGYFINPLVNVALGVLVLKERLRAGQLVAIALAAAGVALMAWSLGEVPRISLALALSFGFYGLLRKIAPVGPLVGLSLETALLLPLAAGYVLWRGTEPGNGLFDHGVQVGLLLMFSGVVTAIPLLWFAAAARRLRLATIGFMQYLAPTCQLGLAVLVYGEPFEPDRARSFGLIWAAIAVFTVDSVIRLRRGAAEARAARAEAEVVPVSEPA
ncbi:MAG TPA: EamA family transporter RarD [Humisphaera sp.]